MIELNIGGKVRGLRFGNYAMMTYNSLTSTNALEIKELNEEYQYIDFVRDITFCALKAYNKVKGEISDFTLEDVTIWVDEMDLANVEVIVKAWTDAMNSSEYIKKSLEALSSNEKKK